MVRRPVLCVLLIVGFTLPTTLVRAASPQVSATDAPAGMELLSYFAGPWTCNGVFRASGKTIASTMRFESDLQGKVLLKYHDDTSPPALYHAIEVWTYDAKANAYNAAVVDNFGGVRDFTSPGWAGSNLVWTSGPSVKRLQQFAYTKVGSDTFTVDWRVSRDGKHYVVGDTLTCKRAS